MKRHPALVPLSRDHHRALLLAQGLRAGGPRTLREELPEDPRARARHFLDVWRTELAPHFALEEETLLPALEGRDAALDVEIARVRDDHEAIRGLVEELRSASDPTPVLEALGERLLAHVRSEERGLFELAQAVVGEAELERMVGADLHESKG